MVSNIQCGVKLATTSRHRWPSHIRLVLVRSLNRHLLKCLRVPHVIIDIDIFPDAAFPRMQDERCLFRARGRWCKVLLCQVLELRWI